MKSRRLAAALCFHMAVAACLFTPAHGRESDDATTADNSLKIYAVKTVKTRLFQRETGFGIFLGNGAVITASHVVGHWPLNVDRRVFIAGQELAANVVKQGSLEDTDLALLTVDAKGLPVSLRLRRNPVCKGPVRVGTEVVVVNSNGTARSRIISPMTISAKYRSKYGTVISDVALAGSGSGVFDANRRCLLGIISRKISMNVVRKPDQRTEIGPAEFAKYFVPAPTIIKFLPAEYRF